MRHWPEVRYSAFLCLDQTAPSFCIIIKPMCYLVQYSPWKGGGGGGECRGARGIGGSGGRHSDYSWVSMCVQHLWKPTLIEWFLGWQIITLFEWQTVKITLSDTILFKILWYKDTLFHIFAKIWVIFYSSRPRLPLHQIGESGASCNTFS